MKASIDQPWMKYYQHAKNKEWPHYDSAYLAIRECARVRMNEVAISYYGQNIKYLALFERIDQYASALDTLGVRQGDIVTIMMLNSPDSIALFYALNKIGAVANFVSGTAAEERIVQAITLTQSKLVITLDVFLDKLERIRSQITSVEKIIVTDLTSEMSFVYRHLARIVKNLKPKTLPQDPIYMSWKQFLAIDGNDIKPARGEDLPAAIIYTSGTTGGSKGVVVTNVGLMTPPLCVILAEMGYQPRKTFLNHIPMFVISGLVITVQFPLMHGIKIIGVVPMSAPLPQILKKYKPNYIMSYPEDYYTIDREKEQDLSFLEIALCGSDFLSATREAQINAYLARCGSQALINNGYGLSEASSGVSINLNNKRKEGSVGLPMFGITVAICAPNTLEELDCGQTGEICVHSKSVMKEYYNQPEETAKVLRMHDDGKIWLHTGDLGYVDEDGYLFINGRLKRNIDVRIGNTYERVFAAEIEAVLRKHPDVVECFVVPKEDNEKVYIPVAFIRVRSELISEALYQSISQFAHDNMDEFHRPDMYVFVDEYPLTAAQKVDFVALEKRASGIPRTPWTTLKMK